jgi:hypothetical protein
MCRSQHITGCWELEHSVCISSQDEHLPVAAAATSSGYLLRIDYVTESSKSIHLHVARTSIVLNFYDSGVWTAGGLPI